MDLDKKIQQPEQKDCPYCAEKIAFMAKKCKHCGELLDPQLRDLDMLKKSQVNVVNNLNTAIVSDFGTKKFPHLIHLIMALLTGGAWILVWVIHYLLRDRKYYL